MESLEQREPVDDRADYRVVLLDDLSPSPRELRNAALGTVAVHLCLLLVLLSIPRDVPDLEQERPRTRITHLIDPPSRLTQKAPN